ncbi:MAG: DUF3306 domain-containing protein [Alphaproteobacteria bacterium]
MVDSQDDSFLSRWSRRKRDEDPDQAPVDSDDQVLEAANAGQPNAGDDGGNHEGKDEGDEEGDPEVVARLPDIDGMDDSSDFKVFLQAGVPDALRRRALRKLWRVNPVLANLDGLNDYDEDYSQLHLLGQGMKTLYQVGKGFVTDEPDVVADDESPSDATEDPEAETAKLPAPSASESQAAVLDTADTAPSGAESPVRESVEVARNLKGTARNRRWGTPDKSS